MDYRLDERIHASKPSPARRKYMGKRRLWEKWTWFLSFGQPADARIKGALHVPASKQDERLLFTNAPKKDIKNRIVDRVRGNLMRNRVLQKMNKLTLTVSEVA
ncbi:hypothetical protein FOPG_20139 [Fusarium oxysporum f. sp. conglutinans race 2 54008]|uniref:Uncharacterized protein n=1 Tax=Fusarium oxysporum f. sp. conglutinans race 2 54008 TaxID=1089457 RepID=X0GUQ6_FUSOX|nr:hypothetical protein FOPG_20139 [Fusarium oxysporum f. sp. conglutinans race 2 54008]